jgi:hypothetical protein
MDGCGLQRVGQCLAGWWALRLIVGVYSPLSIAAIQNATGTL